MPTGYQRQSVASIVNGNVINASDFNNEYNAILAAFDATLGHNHDGITVGGGAKILAINGVQFPANPSVNTVAVVTSTNQISYEQLPNTAIANSTIQIGTTIFNLGDSKALIDGLTTTNAQLGNGSGTGTVLGANLNITGWSVLGGGTGIVSNTILAGCTTSGVTTLGGNLVATGQTVTNGIFNSPSISSASIAGSTLTGTTTATGSTIAGGGTAILQTFVVSNPIISGSTGTITGTLTGGTLAGVTINGSSTITGTPSIVGATLSGGTTLNGTTTTGGPFVLGGNMTATGFAIAGGGTANLNGFNLNSGCTGITQGAANSTTALATTAFVHAAITNDVAGTFAPLASPTFTGTVTVPTPSTADSSTKAASTAYVQNNLNSYATTASPTFTGTVTVPTPITADNTTKAASTAYVQNQFNFSLTPTGSMAIGPASSSPTIRWGKSTTTAGGTKAISFVPPFTNALVTVQLTPSSTGVVGATMQTSAESTSGFTANAIVSGGAVATDFYWMAIGY